MSDRKSGHFQSGFGVVALRKYTVAIFFCKFHHSSIVNK